MNRARELGNMLDRIAASVTELYPHQRDALHDASRMIVFVGEDLADALRWALEQIEDSLDPDHQAALAAAHTALARAEGA